MKQIGDHVNLRGVVKDVWEESGETFYSVEVGPLAGSFVRLLSVGENAFSGCTKYTRDVTAADQLKCVCGRSREAHESG